VTYVGFGDGADIATYVGSDVCCSGTGADVCIDGGVCNDIYPDIEPDVGSIGAGAEIDSRICVGTDMCAEIVVCRDNTGVN